jgi:hypothetical protein
MLHGTNVKKIIIYIYNPDRIFPMKTEDTRLLRQEILRGRK